MNGPFVKWDILYEKTQKLIDEFEMDFTPQTKVKDLSLAHQQMVEIMKEYNRKFRIIAFDEPTASLSEKEINTLFKLIERLKNEGITILYVSHRMKEVFKITDRIAVLKDGEYVGTVKTSETEECELIKMMVGREVCEIFNRIPLTSNETVLEVKGLTNSKIKNVSFKLAKGEVLGLSGLVGAGRTEVARAIFGADKISSGEIFLNGKQVNINNPKDAIREGIGLCPEDRKNEGLVLLRSVKDNTCVVVLKKLCKALFFIDTEKEEALTHEYVKKLRTKTPSIEQLLKNLSGGNQQKVVLGKWLATKPKVLILDEPTRGIDVGAKSEIYDIINFLTSQGVAILFISSELPEIIGMSDRVLVMKDGQLKGELSRAEATEEKVIQLAMMQDAERSIAI
jgi:L-arabinose transport system ATP-binding protein